MRPLPVLLLLGLSGCPADKAPDDTGGDTVDPSGECTDENEFETWPDGDADGYGASGIGTMRCEVPAGFSDVSGDCDDGDASVHPGAVELCNRMDDDCDGTSDNVDTTWFDDLDGDGYGDDATAVATCLPEAGQTTQAGDCDDAVATTHPGAEEVCNLVDDDCDGVADVGETSTWYSDDDHDGYGNPNVSETTCLPDEGWVQNGDDCRPADPAAFPGAVEECNDADDDCDGDVDEDFDLDGDGHQDEICAIGDDCDDNDPDTYAGAPEICVDGIDQDCDGRDMHCTYDGDHMLVDAWTKLYSDEPNYDAGRMIDVGDVDGDGEMDVLIATFYANGYQGGAALAMGPFTGDATLDDAGHLLAGGSGTTYAGRSIALADLDDDGYDDVAIGAPDGTEKEFILFGPIAADTKLSDADITWSGDYGAEVGHGADAADVSGDGIADAVVGAYEDSTGGYAAGTTFVHFGPLSAGDGDVSDCDLSLVGDSPGAYAGRYLRAGEDVNGDGIGDMLLAAPYSSLGASYGGAVYVVYGGISGEVSLSAADGLYLGEAASDYAGEDLSMGDLDGDGLAEIVVGSYNSTGGYYAGATYVVNGPASGSSVDLGSADTVIRGDSATQYFGLGLAVGDTDGDGIGDLLVGATGDNGGGRASGSAFLFFGPVSAATGPSDADAAFFGEAAGDTVGEGLAIADLDGDGFAELLIGATGEATGGSAAGAVYIVAPD